MGSKPVDLEKLSVEKLKKFIDSFDHVFSDCDGVVWSKEPLPRTGEFFKLVKSLGKTVHFVSNNSLRTRENYKEKFDACGIQDGVENLTYPSIAIAEYLKSINFNKTVYSVSSSETNAMIESYGIQYKYGPDVGVDYYGDYVNYLEDDPEIGAVVFDSDFKINLPKLYKAITYLKRPEVLFINGASDKVVPLKKGCLSLGTGVFTDIVETETKRKPLLLGKPGKMFGEFAMKRANVTNPSRVLFIGDMLEQDVGLGKANGFQTLLVLTNCSKEQMLSSTVRPDFYARSLGDIVPLLENVTSG